MRKVKRYKYLGRNGILTTRIKIEGIDGILMYELFADEGKILTDGERRLYEVIIDAEEVNEWKEVSRLETDAPYYRNNEDNTKK